jgi:hypothetical protein
MHRKLLAVSAFAALIAAGAAQADTIQPRYDLSGSWQPDTGGGTTDYFQEGTELVFVNSGFDHAHHYVGRYITPTKIEGIQHRRDPSGCTIEMLLTITALSADEVSVWSKVLTTACGFVKNQILTNRVFRVD